jgi:membrane-associated protease RseP (regulator of RpoE activity)
MRRRLPGPGVNLALFFLTVASTFFIGALTPRGLDVAQGALFSATIMSILLSHEMGHYVAARYHQVKATLPFFIPFPIPGFSLVGTLGAFIAILSPFPNRRALLDIGLAGPFAGFLVTLPALVVGILEAEVGAPSTEGLTLGEPLLFKLMTVWLRPGLTGGETLYIGPVGLAAWFGLLVTALNLLPIGQLDGGHASYALFRSGAHQLSRMTFFLLFPMVYFGPSWLVWAALVYVLGIRRPHPTTLDDDEPLPRSRKIMGALGYLTFVLCFTPEPIVFDWGELLAALW